MQNISVRESLIKVVKPRGSSGSVYLPKDWVGQRVVVQRLSVKDLIIDALSPYWSDISGLYLYGSYARGEQSDGSDIDVLAVSGKKLPEKVGLISIVSGSVEEIKQKIRNDPVGYYSIVQEAVPVINAPLLEELKKIEPDPKTLSSYFDLTQSALDISKGFLDLGGTDQSAAIYSLVLRLRGLFLLRCRKRGEVYSNQRLKEYVSVQGLDPVAFEDILSVYRADKEDAPLPKQRIPIKTLRKLYEIDKALLKELKDEPQESAEEGHSVA